MTGKVAVITGASQGIGAGPVVGYRKRGWAVVANSLTIKPSGDPICSPWPATSLRPRPPNGSPAPRWTGPVGSTPS
jgi:hypothetical protein